MLLATRKYSRQTVQDQGRNRFKLTSCVLVTVIASVTVRGASRAKLMLELGLCQISDCSSQNVNTSEMSLVQLHRKIPLG